MDYQAAQVNLSSAPICLDMGKGNEKLNLYKDIFKTASKKKHCCVNPIDLCVFGPFWARHWIKGSTETMERWGIKQCCTAAKRGWLGVLIHGSLYWFSISAPCRMTGAAMEPLSRSPGPAQRVKKSLHTCLTIIHTRARAERKDGWHGMKRILLALWVRYTCMHTLWLVCCFPRSCWESVSDGDKRSAENLGALPHKW